jgi:RNA-directed DNA polymerase
VVCGPGGYLEEKLKDLHGRIHRGGYRASPAKRTYIQKPDGSQRPLAILSLEDKIVQQAVVFVLEAIFEADFLGFSYGFRPGRGQHDAVDALQAWILRKRVNWVLDAEVQGFFSAMSHEWTLRFLEHRIAVKRILRLIAKRLKVGIVSKEGHINAARGAPRKGRLFRRFWQTSTCIMRSIYGSIGWRWRKASGDVVIVPYAEISLPAFSTSMRPKRSCRTCMSVCASSNWRCTLIRPD